jgi:hypothetical protein
MLDLLGGRNITLSELPPTDDDWYLNLVWIEREKCLLLTHAGTLFSLFRGGIHVADLRPLGDYLVNAIEAELRAEGLPPTRSPSSSATIFGLPRPRAAARSAS